MMRSRLRFFMSCALLAILVAPAVADAKRSKRPTVRQAERAVVREARAEYGLRRSALGRGSASADCRRLTTRRFKCTWSGEKCFEGLGCTYYDGKARARKYRYGWDVRLYSVKRS